VFDSHCHLDANEYDADRREVIARARAAGVTGIVIPGYEPSSWRAMKELCASDALLACAVGIHPWYVHEVPADERERALADLGRAAQELGAVAIGECGLDAKMAKSGGAPIALQEEVLARHLRVARELQLPIILHCVGAHARLLALLQRDGALSAGGVLHSYSGSSELVRDYLRLNLSFSFAGIVTRANARRPREALKAVPDERLMVESDGPDQAAEGVTPPRAEPAHVALVLAAAAEIREQPREQLAAITTRNARRLFARFPPGAGCSRSCDAS
jgi:TatD DNase family protein